MVDDWLESYPQTEPAEGKHSAQNNPYKRRDDQTRLASRFFALDPPRYPSLALVLLISKDYRIRCAHFDALARWVCNNATTFLIIAIDAEATDPHPIPMPRVPACTEHVGHLAEWVSQTFAARRAQRHTDHEEGA